MMLADVEIARPVVRDRRRGRNRSRTTDVDWPVTAVCRAVARGIRSALVADTGALANGRAPEAGCLFT